MKRQFVETLQEGDRLNDYFVAVRKDLRDQQNGGKFLGMVFKDRTGEIGGVLWNNAASVAQQFEAGDVVHVKGLVATYQDRLQVRVEHVTPIREADYDKRDLVYVHPDAAQFVARFRSIMDTLQEPCLVRLTRSFLDDPEFMIRFETASAGKRWHHECRGGLVQHCYEMARLAEVLCELYPNIQRDLLLTGILLHDIGKLDEMTHDLSVDYTTAGKLLGHLVIGADIVRRKMDEIPDFPETVRLHLLHCILAHHGEYVNGSPVLPKTPEAVALFHLDNLDAQANAFTRIVEETRQRGQNWSDYISLIDRQLWAQQE